MVPPATVSVVAGAWCGDKLGETGGPQRLNPGWLREVDCCSHSSTADGRDVREVHKHQVPVVLSSGD